MQALGRLIFGPYGQAQLVVFILPPTQFPAGHGRDNVAYLESLTLGRLTGYHRVLV